MTIQEIEQQNQKTYKIFTLKLKIIARNYKIVVKQNEIPPEL